VQAMKRLVKAGDLGHFGVFFLVILLWSAWLSALGGVFRAWVVLLASAIVCPLVWKTLGLSSPCTPNGPARRRSRTFYLALAFIIALSVMNVLLFHDARNGTRDEGLYANDAVYLARNGNLPFPSHQGIDTRLFLNVAWDAELYGLAGLPGLTLCNAIPFAVALMCIFLLVSELSGEEAAGFSSVLLASLSYPFLWYSRRTANEIFFFFLFWTSLYFFFRCLAKKHSFKADLTIFALITPLMSFVRPEGVLVSCAGFLGLLFLFCRLRRTPFSYPIIPLIVLLLVVASSICGGLYLMNEKYGFLENKEAPTPSPENAAGAGLPAGNAIGAREYSYTTMVMIRFGIFPALLLILPFALIYLLKGPWRTFIAYLCIASVPFFYYYFKPEIYFDLPWFLRRFTAVVIPLSFVAFCALVFKLRKPWAILITAVYLAITVCISAPIFLHKDYAGMSGRLDEIASALPEDAEVVVDRYALGEYTLTVPLIFAYGRKAVTVEPWKKISHELVNGSREVYFISNSENLQNRYGGGSMVFDDSVSLSGTEIIWKMDVLTSFLQPTCEFHRGGNVATWPSMDWRIALSRVEVPSEIVEAHYELVIVRMHITPAASGERTAGT